MKGRLFNHPVHLMLVHFPTALFPAGFLFDIAGIILTEPQLFAASFYTIVLGVAAGLAAGLFGFLDYIKLADRPKVFRIAGWHAIIQLSVLVVFGIILGLKFRTYPDFLQPDIFQLSAMGLILGVMLFGNYLGGELVFTHRVGFNGSNKDK